MVKILKKNMPEKEKYDIEEIMIDVISGETLSLENPRPAPLLE